jgi:putative MFS transporter
MSLMLGLARLAAFAALPIGWMGDHRGRRRPFLIAMTLVVIGGSAAGFAVEAWQFGALHAVLRTGTAAASALGVVILAESISAPNRAYSISFFGAAVSLGSGLALMALPLADGGGDSWRIPHLMVAIGFLVLPFLIRRVPESTVYSRQPEGGHWGELLTGPWARRFWTIVVINILVSAYGAVGAAFSTERMIEDVGMSTGDTVLILLIGGTIGGLGFFVGGHLADAWGRKRTSIVALLLTIVGGVTLYTSTSIPVIVAAAVVSTFGTFAFVPAGGSHRAELFPTSLRSSANTAASNAGLVGSALGLISGVYTIDRFGLSETVYLLSIGVVVAAMLTTTLDETRGQDLTAVVADRR